MIQLTSNLSGYHRTDALSSMPSQKPLEAKVQAETGDHLSSANTEILRNALAKNSEIRPEVVARGKALAVDETYPPRRIIESIAKLMSESRDVSA